MNIGNSLSFKGQIKITTYEGKEHVEKFKTTQEQDRLIKMAADASSPNGIIANKIEKNAANAFAALIEMITGKPLLKTNQTKLMTNGYDESVDYGDKKPIEGGVFVEVTFDKKA